MGFDSLTANRYILKLIDHNVAELFLPFEKHVGIFAEKVDGEVYEVEEIKTEIFALLLNVAEYYCIGLALRLERGIVEVRVGKVLNVCELVFVELYLVYHKLEARRVHFNAHFFVYLF